jgi:hypothetical protein
MGQSVRKMGRAAQRYSAVPLSEGITVAKDRQLSADSVEKVGLAAARRRDVPAFEVAASHFKLPFGVSLSVLAQV